MSRRLWLSAAIFSALVALGSYTAIELFVGRFRQSTHNEIGEQQRHSECRIRRNGKGCKTHAPGCEEKRQKLGQRQGQSQRRGQIAWIDEGRAYHEHGRLQSRRVVRPKFGIRQRRRLQEIRRRRHALDYAIRPLRRYFCHCVVQQRHRRLRNQARRGKSHFGRDGIGVVRHFEQSVLPADAAHASAPGRSAGCGRAR